VQGYIIFFFYIPVSKKFCPELKIVVNYERRQAPVTILLNVDL
jgi:hypothetical protein